MKSVRKQILKGVDKRERERESCILESKDVSLLSDFAKIKNYNINNIKDVNNNEINFLNRYSRAMYFSES